MALCYYIIINKYMYHIIYHKHTTSTTFNNDILLLYDSNSMFVIYYVTHITIIHIKKSNKGGIQRMWEGKWRASFYPRNWLSQNADLAVTIFRLFSNMEL